MDGDFLKLSIIGASLQGKGHMADGVECQDYFEKYESNGIYAVALSDGAGSKTHSYYGARAVVPAIIKYLADNFPSLIASSDREIEKSVLKIGVQALREQGENISDFACTLLFLVTDGERYICGNIGDGKIFSYDNHASLLMYGESGNSVNETNFISDATASLYFKVIKGYFSSNTLFVLTTDGIGNLLFDRSSNKPCAALDKIKSWTEKYSEEQVEYILKENTIEVFRELTVDDVSIVLVYKNTEALNRENKNDGSAIF